MACLILYFVFDCFGLLVVWVLFAVCLVVCAWWLLAGCFVWFVRLFCLLTV